MTSRAANPSWCPRMQTSPCSTDCLRQNAFGPRERGWTTRVSRRGRPQLQLGLVRWQSVPHSLSMVSGYVSLSPQRSAGPTLIAGRTHQDRRWISPERWRTCPTATRPVRSSSARMTSPWRSCTARGVLDDRRRHRVRRDTRAGDVAAHSARPLGRLLSRSRAFHAHPRASRGATR